MRAPAGGTGRQAPPRGVRRNRRGPTMTASRFRDRLPLLAVVAGSVLAAGLGAAVAQNVGNYSVQGGGDWEVGSLLHVRAGGALTSDDCAGAGVPVDMRIGSATAQTSFLFVANRAWKVSAVRARIATAAGSALTATVNKVANAAAAGTAAPVHSGTINLNAASDTAQAMTVVTTSAATLAAGDALYWSMSSTVGSTLGVVAICLAPQ